MTSSISKLTYFKHRIHNPVRHSSPNSKKAVCNNNTSISGVKNASMMQDEKDIAHACNMFLSFRFRSCEFCVQEWNHNVRTRLCATCRYWSVQNYQGYIFKSYVFSSPYIYANKGRPTVLGKAGAVAREQRAKVGGAPASHIVSRLLLNSCLVFHMFTCLLVLLYDQCPPTLSLPSQFSLAPLA